jgi:hypothetical protein
VSAFGDAQKPGRALRVNPLVLRPAYEDVAKSDHLFVIQLLAVTLIESETTRKLS